eukprot:8336209-Pyramimonas_sp.AAC.1
MNAPCDWSAKGNERAALTDCGYASSWQNYPNRFVAVHISRRVNAAEPRRLSFGTSGPIASTTHVCAALTSRHGPATALMQ